MKSGNILRKMSVLTAVVLFMAFAMSISAQVQTQTTKTPGMATREVKVESGQVVDVEGNDLFVKMADGSIRHFPNVPDSAMVNVDGKQLGIHDLKPGMQLQRTTITTTTPMWVTTVQSVTGKVWHTQPPHWVILTMENGENQKFQVPEGTKFTVGGQEADVFALKKGMVVTATKIVESSQVDVAKAKMVTGTIAPGTPVLVAKGQPTPASGGGGTTAEAAGAGETTTASNQLPKTGSNLPLLGFIGLLFISASVGVALLRRTMGQA